MKKKYTINVIFSAFLLAFLSACSQYPNLEWKPEVVSPLVKGSLSAEQQFNIVNQAFFISARLPVPPVVVVPPYAAFNNVSTPWSPLSYAGSPATLIGIDSLVVSGTIVNNTPIKINAGAKILIRNVGEITNLIEIPLTQDILPGKNAAFSQTKVGGVLYPNFEMGVANISSTGNTTPVAFGPTNGLDISFKMNFLKISYFDIAPNIKGSLDITNPFAIDQKPETTVASGKLDVFIKNAIPLNMVMQAYLLDENKVLLDSLFASPLAIAAATERPLTPTTSTSNTSTQRIINNLDKTRFLRFKASYNTLGKTFNTRITPSINRLDFKVIGDLVMLIKG